MICKWFKRIRKKPYVSINNSSEWSLFEIGVLFEINKLRKELSSPLLKADSNLHKLSKQRALECRDIGNLDNHDGFNQVAKTASNLGIRLMGENLARFYESPESLVSAWYNSPKHKSIMLSSQRNIAGVGFSKDGKKNYICLLVGKI